MVSADRGYRSHLPIAGLHATCRHVYGVKQFTERFVGVTRYEGQLSPRPRPTRTRGSSRFLPKISFAWASFLLGRRLPLIAVSITTRGTRDVDATDVKTIHPGRSGWLARHARFLPALQPFSFSFRRASSPREWSLRRKASSTGTLEVHYEDGYDGGRLRHYLNTGQSVSLSLLPESLATSRRQPRSSTRGRARWNVDAGSRPSARPG